MQRVQRSIHTLRFQSAANQLDTAFLRLANQRPSADNLDAAMASSDCIATVDGLLDLRNSLSRIEPLWTDLQHK